jgi:hypothetical protein
MAFRLSYHDLAARATEAIPRERLARAIEQLSAAYREGRTVHHERSREARAAYLVHTLPAHVCDAKRLLLDELEDELRRDELRVLALGAGPGTEALALADAWATLAAAGGAPPGRLLHVTRLDRVASWDEPFAALRREADEALPALDPSLGTAWRWETPPAALVCDLGAGVLGEDAVSAIGAADLLLAANVVSEIEPRSTPALPRGFAATLGAIARAARPGAALVLLDRAHAPGVVARLEASIAALGAARPVEATPIREREIRCACGLTRATKALYARVKLPTTKVEDRPIGNTRTAWTLVRML